MVRPLAEGWRRRHPRRGAGPPLRDGRKRVARRAGVAARTGRADGLLPRERRPRQHPRGRRRSPPVAAPRAHAAGHLHLRSREASCSQPPAATRARRRISAKSSCATTCWSTPPELLGEDLEVTGPLGADAVDRLDGARHRLHRRLVDRFPTARPGRWPTDPARPVSAPDQPRAADAGRADRDHDRPRRDLEPVQGRAPHPARGLEQQLPALRSQSEHRRRLRRGRRDAHGAADHPARRGAPVTADPADRAAVGSCDERPGGWALVRRRQCPRRRRHRRGGPLRGGARRRWPHPRDWRLDAR